MKKTLLTVALVAMAAVSSFAQGTIAFGNNTLTRVLLAESVGGATRNAASTDGLTFSVWFGPADSARDALTQAPGTASIGNSAGIMVDAPSVFALPGTQPNQVVSLQIRATGAAYAGETKVAQVTLGETAGPGTVIWQTASGTFGTRFTPLIVTPIVPEPSTIALGVLGLGSLLLFRRRK